MRFFLIVFLLASSFVYTSCSSVKDTAYLNETIKSPLLGGNTSALYKANIKVFGKFFSGLILFKYNKKEQACNIVLLTEVGLTLCEFYSVNDMMEVKSASSLFQSKMAQQTLADDFSYLLHHPGGLKQVSQWQYINKNRVRYFQNNKSELCQIRKKRLVNGVMINLNNYKQGVPNDINFKHRGIKFNMKLKLLKVS